MKIYTCLMFMAGMLFSCGNESGQGGNDANITITVKDDVSDVMYGDSVDFSKLIDVSSSVSGQVYTVSAESLTPDTLTIDSNSLNKGMATGVGECKAKVSVLNKSVVVTFNSHAHISSYKTTSPGELLVGDTFNLDDYVTCNVSKPNGAKGDYIATSLSTTTASIGEDGKTVTILGAGKINIKITDFTKKKVAYVAGTAVTNFQKQVSNFTSKLKNNYTVFNTINGEFVDGFGVYHTDNYTFYPYQFLLGTDYWGNKPPYQGVVSFDSGNVYSVSANYTSNEEGYVDSSSLKIVEKMAFAKDQYYCFDDFPVSVVDGMKYNKNGDDEYLTCSFTSSFNSQIFGNVMGISYSTGAIATVKANLETIFGGTSKEQTALVFTFVTSNGAEIQIAIGDVGTTSINGLPNYLADSSNEPESVSYDPIKSRIDSIVAGKNYTVTGRTYVRDSDGTELTVQQAAAKAEILHLFYYTSSAKFTENGMLRRNLQSYKGVGSGNLPDKQFTTGYMNKDGNVYEVSCEKADGDEVINGTLSLGTDPITQDGSNISSYLDNSNLISLASIPASGYDDLNMLGYDADTSTYTFNLKPKGKNGTTLLRNLCLSSVYETYPNTMFPSDIGTNDYESGYFGQGSLTLKDDGGFKFFYYVAVTSQVSSSGNIDYQMAIEIEVSDVGTTSISEYDAL